jgi:hypothetical protein
MFLYQTTYFYYKRRKKKFIEIGLWTPDLWELEIFLDENKKTANIKANSYIKQIKIYKKNTI